MKKSIKRLLSGALGALMLVGMIPSALAASEAEAVIDYSKTCSLELYKIDFTAAEKDGVWTWDDFKSTGMEESYVYDKLINNVVRVGDTDSVNEYENGQTANGYAINGVEFSYLRVADVLTYSEVVGDTAKIHNLYGFRRADTRELLTAIGLYAGGRYVDEFVAESGASSQPLDNDKVYFEAETLNKYLADALTKDATTVKNQLEAYAASSSLRGKMPLTDANGYTKVEGLGVGLYLLVETAVPEMVTSTTNPFFVSLPMTTIDGDANSVSHEGGHFWNYNVVLYPKNETGIPTLEKTVREAKDDTGKNDGSDAIDDGFAHTATASTGDTLEWQIISTLPTITSEATALKHLSWTDTLDAGLTYNKDATIYIYSDKECTNEVAKWSNTGSNFDQEFFTVKTRDDQMVITITDAGLNIINGYNSTNVNSTSDKLYTSFSNYTIRIRYTTVINSDASFVYGDEGNDNLVIFKWERTSQGYYDTLVDDAHVYSYGIDILKLFADKADGYGTQAMYDHVKFVVHNMTDGYYVQAELNEDEGVYYVTGHTPNEAAATKFIPVLNVKDNEMGRIVIKGLEDDEYMITEVETMDGYTLLTDHRYVLISVEESDVCDIYEREIDNYLKGLVQNDSRYDEDSVKRAGWTALNPLTNIPQEHLEHRLLTASAQVDGTDIEMRSSESAEAGKESPNAIAALEIVNHVIIEMPKTGDDSIYMMAAFGTLALASALCLIVLPLIKRRKEDEEVEDEQ